MKTCSVCKQEKTPTEYYKNKKAEDGLEHKCKECRSKYAKSRRGATRLYYLQNREKIRAYQTSYYAKKGHNDL